MARPTITIDGETFELKKTLVQVFRKILKLEMERREIPLNEFVDRHCEIIALAFGVTEEQVYDNLDVADVIPKYSEVSIYLSERLAGRIKKNEAEETAVQV